MAFADFTDHGFPETITDGEGMYAWQRAVGRPASFPTGSDLRPTAGGGTRQVNIAAGRVTGGGVASELGVAKTVTLPDPGGSTVRYHLIVAEFVWGASSATTGVRLATIATGSAQANIPSFTRNEGTLWQVPICLAAVKGGVTGIHDLIDLRVQATFGHNYSIYNSKAMELLDFPGVSVYDASTDRVLIRAIASNGSRTWVPMATERSLEYTATTTFGNSAAGFSTLSTARPSELIRDGKRRTLFLEQKKLTDVKYESSSTGHIVNFVIFNLSSVSDRPRKDTLAHFRYQNSNMVDFRGGASVTTSGDIYVTSMMPSTDIVRAVSAGLWSTQIEASWYVD
jgi:hypothetical protein